MEKGNRGLEEWNFFEVFNIFENYEILICKFQQNLL